MQKSLFIQKQSQEPGDQKCEVQNGRQKSSQSKYVIRTKNLNFRKNRQGLGRIRIGKQRGKLAYSKSAQKNHQRSDGGQTNRPEYICTRILNILRGSWDMRRD